MIRCIQPYGKNGPITQGYVHTKHSDGSFTIWDGENHGTKKRGFQIPSYRKSSPKVVFPAVAAE